MADAAVEALDNPFAVKQLRRQARYVYVMTSFIALSLTVAILFV